jgi:hypothetical protein
VDPARRAERALAAAQASFQAGAFDAALGLVATTEAGPLDEFQLAQADLLRAHVAFASGLGSDAPPLLLKAARQLEPVDLDLARETYLAAWGAAGMAGLRAAGPVLAEICRAVVGPGGLYTISARQVRLVRDAGALAQLPLYLAQLGIALPWTGDFAGTAAVIAETDSVAAATGSPIAPYTLLRLSGRRSGRRRCAGSRR